MTKEPEIPIIDLQEQYRAIKNMVDQSLQKVLMSGVYILGAELEAFEKEFAFFLKSKRVIGVNSGTDALYLSMRALGIGPGDEVITSPLTFVSTVQTILALGANPVFADVREFDSNIDPESVRSKITKKTKAILPVHLFGFPADMSALKILAEEHGLKIIEDCAQSAGAYYGGVQTGTIGDAGCFSFYPTKNLGACGDGGAIVVQDDDVAERLRNLRTHGSTLRGWYEELGVNSRLDEMQATILRIKLLYLGRWNIMRRKLAKNYDDLFAGLKQVTLFKAADKTTPVYCLYPIRVVKRDSLQEHLVRLGIHTIVHYPVPLHLSTALSSLGYGKGDYPVAEKLAAETLALPMYPELAFTDQERILNAISSFYHFL